jgi:hypothetical protein
MESTYRAVMACFMTFALAACATEPTAPLESQSKPRDARLARLYFIRPGGMVMRFAIFDIKVDGKVVGKIAHDSYLFVDRQPGTYTLRVEPPADWTYFETEVQVAAGGTYYYTTSVNSGEIPISGGGFVTMHQPHPGTPMQPKGGGISFASVKLNSLDPGAAAVEIAKLDAQ